ncbi:oxygenase MpaB family protein [Stackebrandtia nassauensis]|uniref:ER-bound oxygenase mpaB/mpaB'/Rubber oxygenase catalytic domain-containing protein n=1 Tax=Stackebrandtia nassauensis (strain DSM 44728 / CIP 108903 / NRRL B-16338 / NBRC 102104 / LLR-40K-21) TaxID=446470 RepID=D3Q248_STANL|nr:oxygenase MpaB family protein [Stackebrandtia nassauensis]ADD41915.1 conserved hypothetical protein [Stackebrandtia nassauensis DSM 44728]
MRQDEGLFGPDSVTWPTNIEFVMWIAGLRALYLQSLHPKVMRGTYQNSALFDKKKAWSRFVRTVRFVHVRTYGTTEEAETAAARVRAIHSRLTAFDPDTGRHFRLDEPDGLLWVHCAEISSYVDIAHRSGILTAPEADRYVDEHRRAAALIGLNPTEVPASRSELDEYFTTVRPSLYACPEALRGLLTSFNPPLPTRLSALKLAVPAANVLALSTLPRWAKHLFGAFEPPGSHTLATAQLRLLRTATRPLLSRGDPIPEARQAAHEMAAGTFSSTLLPN